jgi:ribosomal protein L37AE/L43A
MTNPACPNCGRLMYDEWRNTIVGTEMKGRSKFWVCKSCKIKFKIGAETIRRKGKVLTDEEIRKNLGLPPKAVTSTVSSPKQTLLHKRKHKKEKQPALFFPSEPALLTTPFNTEQPKEDEKK